MDDLPSTVVINDQALQHWWEQLGEKLRRQWLHWHPADGIPPELAAQLRDHLPGHVQPEYLFRLAEPDTGEVLDQWLATDRLADAVEAKRHEMHP